MHGLGDLSVADISVKASDVCAGVPPPKGGEGTGWDTLLIALLYAAFIRSVILGTSMERFAPEKKGCNLLTPAGKGGGS